ncbi:MAG: arylesterase [Acidobacteriaceae bacterium]
MIVKPISMLVSSCALLLTLLAGCGHSTLQSSPANSNNVPTSSQDGKSPAGGVDNSAPPKSSPPVRDTRPVIVAFGDSLTAGYGTNAGQSYPDYLQQDLNALGYRYRVVNAGISGNTSKDGVARLPEIVARLPTVAIIAFGGNDGLRGVPILDTEMNLRTMIATLQDAHVKVILGGITLPPNYGGDYIAKFDAIYRKQSHAYHVPLLPFMLKDVYGVPGDMQADGIHATAKGNEQVAKNFLPLLLPLLHKGPK